MTSEDGSDHYQALVFIETSGNQAYLYATNKLKENIGASELTYSAGAKWAKNAVDELDAKPIILTSGKAMFLVRSEEEGRHIVQMVTEQALREAPGLQVAGAVVSLAKGHAAAIADAHHQFNRNRDAMASTRFAVLPWSEPCATSGMPAIGTSTEGERSLLFSPECLAKRQYAPDWLLRVKALFKDRGSAAGEDRLFPARRIDELQQRFDESQWVGVIFSDGNGLGQIFLDLETHLDELKTRGGPSWQPFEAMQAFSTELQEATESAFYEACNHIHNLGASVEKARAGRRAVKDFFIPVVPLVLAGDDLTVMVQGEYALPFTERFLVAFEQCTERCKTISAIAEVALGAPRLSAGAGVALVKPHFPFHLAHELAEGLLRSAKLAKRHVFSARDGGYAENKRPYPVSAMDFHVMFDASYTDLQRIREQRLTVGDDRLYAGPYVVTPEAKLVDLTEQGRDWVSSHRLSHLTDRIAALNARDPDNDRLKLPSTQMHALRAAIAQGSSAADARLRTLGWLDQAAMQVLKETEQSLFTERGEDRITRFVDALSASGFWPVDDQIEERKR